MLLEASVSSNPGRPDAVASRAAGPPGHSSRFAENSRFAETSRLWRGALSLCGVLSAHRTVNTPCSENSPRQRRRTLRDHAAGRELTAIIGEATRTARTEPGSLRKNCTAAPLWGRDLAGTQRQCGQHGLAASLAHEPGLTVRDDVYRPEQPHVHERTISAGLALVTNLSHARICTGRSARKAADGMTMAARLAYADRRRR